jgi:tRNA(His) 5'-end guanylyltransferase
MLAMACDAHAHFNPETTYTHSDEVSFVFAASPSTTTDMQHASTKATACRTPAAAAAAAATDTTNTLLYAGRVIKIASIIASYCSVRFVSHLSRILASSNSNAAAAALLQSDPPFFDGRAFTLPNTAECSEYLLWRNADCKRNSCSSFARQYFSQSRLQNMPSHKVQYRSHHHVY